MTLCLQLMVLEEGDGPSTTSDEPGDTEEEEPVDVEQPAPAAAATAATPPRGSQPQSASTEDLSTKKKPPPSRIAGSGLRAPTAGKSECLKLVTH